MQKMVTWLEHKDIYCVKVGNFCFCCRALRRAPQRQEVKVTFASMSLLLREDKDVGNLSSLTSNCLPEH